MNRSRGTGDGKSVGSGHALARRLRPKIVVVKGLRTELYFGKPPALAGASALVVASEHSFIHQRLCSIGVEAGLDLDETRFLQDPL